MNKLISVIMPVYNTEKYLRKCLDSVCNQTLRDIEIICVNDCSTDGSLAILQEYAVKDSRMRVLTNKVNLKAAGARNIGLDNATGDYIYFLDSDDYIDTDYLQQLYDKAEQYHADIVMNTNILTEKADKVVQYFHPSMPDIPLVGCVLDSAMVIDKSFCAVWMRLFRRRFIEDKQIRFRVVNMAEDNVFHYMTNINATVIYAFNGSAAYHYIIRDDSLIGIVKKNNQSDLFTMKAYNLIYDYLVEKDLLKNNRARIFNVSGFFKVDTEEKFVLYKSYFEKVKGYLAEHKEQYNAMDLFFANCILSCNSFEDYKKHYPSSVVMVFLKKRKK